MQQAHQPLPRITAGVWVDDPMLQHPTNTDRNRPKQAKSHEHAAYIPNVGHAIPQSGGESLTGGCVGMADFIGWRRR